MSILEHEIEKLISDIREMRPSELLSEKLAERIGCTIHEAIEEARQERSVASEIRSQLERIKAKDRITVKEAALLLSCSESHLRKLVRASRAGKSRRPIPFVDIEGVTVFPVEDLMEWASPARSLKVVNQAA